MCFGFCFSIVKAFSAKWKMPVLCFQTCNNYAGYICIDLVDEAYPASKRSTTNEDSSSTLRRIIPLHIRGTSFNYLESSDVLIDNQNDTFHSKLRSIFLK